MYFNLFLNICHYIGCSSDIFTVRWFWVAMNAYLVGKNTYVFHYSKVFLFDFQRWRGWFYPCYASFIIVLSFQGIIWPLYNNDGWWIWLWIHLNSIVANCQHIWTDCPYEQSWVLIEADFHTPQSSTYLHFLPCSTLLWFWSLLIMKCWFPFFPRGMLVSDVSLVDRRSMTVSESRNAPSVVFTTFEVRRLVYLVQSHRNQLNYVNLMHMNEVECHHLLYWWTCTLFWQVGCRFQIRHQNLRVVLTNWW